ncbi:MAG: disulfide bond formation protein B [Porticoccaceae bacterium]
MNNSLFASLLLPSSARVWYVILVLWSVLSMLGAVFYFQMHLGLEPCYLCITQRFFVVAIGVVAAIGLLFKPLSRMHCSLHLAIAVLSIAGSGFSIKQLWLQNLSADQVPACGPPVEYLFDAFPASEIIAMLIQGDGNCAEIQWQLLGLSMPAWVLIMFVAVLGVTVWRLQAARQKH